MSRTAATVVLVCLAGAGVGSAVWLSRDEPRPISVALPTAPPPHGTADTHAVLGVSGCLSAACHGGPAADTLSGTWPSDGTGWRSAGTHWLAADPHRGAYAVLLSTEDTPRRRPDRPTAYQIMTHLGRKRADGTRIEAFQDERCLACHTTPAAAAETAADHLKALRVDGVGCESCHGSAGSWVGPHTTKAWGEDRRGHYGKYGMTPLYDVGVRAETCVGCHVGAPADGDVPVRDMNHDMIAAGHPALNFDFAEYHRRLPKHWVERKRVTGHDPTAAGSEARRWLVGRVAHAEAACRLLADRLVRSKPKDQGGRDDPRTPWPEFAEFDCATCHHSLPGDRPGVRGELAWQPVWPVTGGFGRAGYDEVKPLLGVMTARKPPGWGKLKTDELTAVADKLKARRQDLVAKGGDVGPQFPDAAFREWKTDWDPLGQVLLGLAAVERDRRAAKGQPADFDPAFGKVREHLNWPAARGEVDKLLPKR